MINITKSNLCYIYSLLFLLIYKQAVGMVVAEPFVKAGTAKLTGSIKSLSGSSKDSIFINVTIPHPISGEYAKYKAFVDRTGNFSIEVNVETVVSLIALNTSLAPEKYLLVKLKSGTVTNLDIAYKSNFGIENIHVTPSMNQNDVIHGFEVQNKMIGYRSGRTPEPLYNKSTDYFLNYVKNALSERLAIVNNDTLISKELKDVLIKDQRLIVYYSFVFDYKDQMILNYRNTNVDKSKEPSIEKIDKTYFRFLKDLNLNDQQYLYCFNFLEFQKEILGNEILALPAIGESDIPSWLASVKAILSDLVGFKNGSYYDILAANSYAKQLNEEVKPLTEKQKKNIINYWKKGEIAKILFRKNKQVIEQDMLKSPFFVNDVSSVANEKVIETIVSKHKGKAVFIDLWATWCAPCLDAMQQFRSTKDNFRNKDVAFIYVTNGSSPRKLWEQKIKGIGNEHYYLNGSQWNYIMKNFEFEGIPSYLLYNKKGVLVNKFIGFPGSEEVKRMINSLL
ncbi:TlpA family protein disulfide reductase [Pedobacter sp. GSP4]|uniref:TlpA family protein disulfide reductase n=1 Tax=Pedobacter sp. GSP4 TaxID=3453716 RepID=UPI003EEC6B99